MPQNAAAFLFILFASCSQSYTLSSKERLMVTDTVQKTLKAYYDDIRKNGLNAEFKYLDSTADFFWVPPGYSGALSYDSIKTILNKNANQFTSVNNQFEDLRIIPLNSELASYTARINSTMNDSAGKTYTYKLVETGIIIKRKDGWKLFNGQTAIIN
jgi:hypothetical protein